ncbi:bifunctional glycosyltransferase/CDP-glycerol:glycerophosphate glycerophosphotransferase [Candidatus Enterococcus huntleyi]|uniref:bifunctional glycosyltransferase/CDP-glycerol:glycerophosphate glycerophosphotransferase n=1 Tax=Candidatus Enterococcus huntleyi TaxID=1857217 RepID=UPI00137A6C37|nr:CDP-glycerol glycerophosphotransferase family protein [Enterococcus sp. JM4C]
MAVYNVENYVKEAVESLMSQKFSKMNQVEVILVNDGSTDHSKEICLELKKLYPDNVVFIDSKNYGVAGARNKGLKVATGKYINFLDPDDGLSESTLSDVYKFFEQHYTKVDVVSIPMMMFGDSRGPHPLNYKFVEDGLIDLEEHFDYIQMSSPSSFFKSTAIQEERFDETMKYAEDAKFIMNIIGKKDCYGVVTTCHYKYRRRKTSATQTGPMDKNWYTDYFKKFSLAVIEKHLKMHGEEKTIPKYVQYTVLYDLRWRIQIRNNVAKLTEDELIELFAIIKEILFYIEDRTILSLRKLSFQYKRFLLSLKENSENNFFHEYEENNDYKMVIGENELGEPNIFCLSEQKISVDLIQITKSKIKIEGNIGTPFDLKKAEISVVFQGKVYPTVAVDRYVQNLYFVDTLIKEYNGFRVELPYEIEGVKYGSISFIIKYKGKKFVPKISYGNFSYLKDSEAKIYERHGIMLFIDDDRSTIKVDVTSKKLLKQYRNSYIYRLLHRENKKFILKVILYRLMATFIRNKKKKEKWIFIERIQEAGDNAQALFEYCSNKADDIDKVFIINSFSKDFEQLKQYGKVIKYGSIAHILQYLTADKVISSHADEYVYNPFGRNRKFYNDLMDQDYVFLQHGVTKNDMSDWLNKYKKNIRMLLTTSDYEYQSFIDEPYNYTEEEIFNLGFPRFDKLVSKTEKLILFMPTWRNPLVNKINRQTGEREYNSSFKDSEYCQKLVEFLNSPKLIDLLKRTGYKMKFVPHPNIRQQLIDIPVSSDLIETIDHDVSYSELFSVGAILITDYSSIAFDFALLNKHIIYYQFDENHLKDGYFEYETMGFGPVIHELNGIENYVSSLFVENQLINNPSQYFERTTNFYKYTDHENSKRVYEAILDLDS